MGYGFGENSILLSIVFSSGADLLGSLKASSAFLESADSLILSFSFNAYIKETINDYSISVNGMVHHAYSFFMKTRR
jgi:hypothetical protein